MLAMWAADWTPTEVATVTINDPDANMNPGDTDDLEIADELDSVPTIVMGSPKTLATGNNANLEAGDANATQPV